MQRIIEVIVRGVITDGSRVLLCRGIGADRFFLPGGHVEWGERIEHALRRELREELGHSFRVTSCLGSFENIFRRDGERHHEVNFLYEVVPERRGVLTSQEPHIEFVWVEMRDLSKTNLVPRVIRKKLIQHYRFSIIA